MSRHIVKRLEQDYTSLSPAQRVEMELFNARRRLRGSYSLHVEAEDALLWLLEQEGHVNVVANFRRLRDKFNY